MRRECEEEVARREHVEVHERGEEREREDVIDLLDVACDGLVVGDPPVEGHDEETRQEHQREDADADPDEGHQELVCAVALDEGELRRTDHEGVVAHALDRGENRCDATPGPGRDIEVEGISFAVPDVLVDLAQVLGHEHPGGEEDRGDGAVRHEGRNVAEVSQFVDPRRQPEGQERVHHMGETDEGGDEEHILPALQLFPRDEDDQHRV